ncbi:hypothetical protein LMH87_002629 [Akanthomyces muscarius]|uniref:FAD-binding FR-type domain-containing protein n=1 Tax=Akanthomyces muscarius TaxID=2231603 RepID=A0A9W8UJF7_AKAMU|nr:hypothetical protein LMH87_002629 [Akanthomyces muscarius]KAJ4148147.1 hypothetical protein LMH87_002629 [Akanthomyces muscarius]
MAQNLIRGEATISRLDVENPSPNGTLQNHSPGTTIAPFTVGLNGVHVSTDFLLSHVLLGALATVGLGVILIRLVQLGHAHLRKLLSINASEKEQIYFSRNHVDLWPKIKKQIIYAPIWRKRHNREIKLSSAVSLGTLPTRLQSLLLGLYVLGNVVFCVALDYRAENMYAILAELRGRTGALAAANLVPLVLFAGRNNPLIVWLQVSFDTYILLHRWTGRLVVLETIIHTAAWAVVQAASKRWDGVLVDLGDPYMTWGSVAAVAAVCLILISPGPVRHAFYETFLNIHIILAVLFILGTYLHCSIPHLPALPYVVTAGVLWAGERFLRILWTAKRNVSRGGSTTADISVLPDGACRVTLHLPHHLRIDPGMHAYLRFPNLRPWESHPFSIAWHEEHTKTDSGALRHVDSAGSRLEKTTRRVPARTSVSFVIQARTGFTLQLWKYAQENASVATLSCRTHAFLEGPYGGHHSLDSYGHVVLVAGASGITHQLSYIRHLLDGRQKGIVATRRVVLVWAIRKISHLQWAEPWLSGLVAMSREAGMFEARVYVTSREGVWAPDGADSDIEIFSGRPNMELIIREQVNCQVGSMCVTVCGPGGLADDVRQATRDVQTYGSVDFIEEAFTW